MAKEFNISGLGSSDFHMLDEIGLVGTRVFGSPSNYEDVLKAIKEKKVEAFIRRDTIEVGRIKTYFFMMLY